ncbi:hypothetical protein CQW23_28620 [Capsicum baccatum]|uniref:Protein FAR1-RELATED SEQUENCE n=1 Tax=Capsicum baccatum TaxID=33114 RepID=A0A2G2VH41_CAPBA|nr:hypothetical protein CQW23_28620 [Capsicum baccatum]
MVNSSRSEEEGSSGGVEASPATGKGRRKVLVARGMEMGGAGAIVGLGWRWRGGFDSSSMRGGAEVWHSELRRKGRISAPTALGFTGHLVTVILEHNHELDPALSCFLPYHAKLSRTLKRSLIAHDIASLRPSKSIRLLKVEARGSKRMECTPKDRRNYILQEQRL